MSTKKKLHNANTRKIFLNGQLPRKKLSKPNSRSWGLHIESVSEERADPSTLIYDGNTWCYATCDPPVNTDSWETLLSDNSGTKSQYY